MRKIVITAAICVIIIVLGYAVFVVAQNQANQPRTSSEMSQIGQTSQTSQTSQSTQPAAPDSAHLLIAEDKTGWSIAGEELPAQHDSKEFDLAKDSSIYEGLTEKGGENARCILTITGISGTAATVTILEDGQEISREMKYGTEYQYTAFTNPDEYSYVFTIKFTK